MENQRFDQLARTLAARISRRTALRRGGVGVAAGLAVAAGMALPAAAQTTPRYTRIRRYQLATGTSFAQLSNTLNTGYLPLIEQAQGFLEYSVIDGGKNSAGLQLVATITAFQTKAQFDAADQQLATWVQQNLASLLPAPTDETSGPVVVHGEICPAAPATPTPTATTAPPTVPPTAPPSTPCTGQGCACNMGTQNPCDGGLLCCNQSGTVIPGGAGVCSPINQCVCSDPDRPGVGCSCQTGTQNPCGDDTLQCCGTTNALGGPGICTPSSVGCQPMGTPTASS